VNGASYRVIGVMESKGGTGFMNQDTQAFIPITTAMSRVGRGNQFRGGNNVNSINVKITDTTVQESVAGSQFFATAPHSVSG
jgi:hypothetical protein